MYFSSKAILIFLLLVVALVPRVYQLGNTPIYPDEITWMVRSKETVFAIKQLNWKYFETAWWTEKSGTIAIGAPLVFISGIFLILTGQNQSTISLNLFPDFIAARLPLAILNSFFIIVFYFFTKRIASQKVAFFSSILLALDPVHIANSRLSMQDGLLTFFTFTAVSSYALTARLKHWLLLAFFSLIAAFLTKPQGILALNTGVVMMTKNINSFKKQWLILSLSILIFMTAIFLFWSYLSTQFTLSQQGMRNFFMGQISFNPPPYYYLFQITTRLPAIIFVGLALFPIFAFNIFRKVHYTKFIKNYLPQIAIFSFCFLFLLLFSLSAKKPGARYILPLWPWIYLASGWSLVQTAQFFQKSFFKFLFLTVVVLSSFVSVARYSPDYYLFYNSLIGGPKNAQQYDLVGLCCGAKESAEFINKYYPTTHSVFVIGCSSSILPYYYSKKIAQDWQSAQIVVVENSFAQLLPNDEKIKHFNQLTPIHQVEAKGAILAKIYLNN